MVLVLLIVGFFLAFIVVETVKGMHTNAKDRWEDQVMADYLRAQDARYHRYRLEAIDRAVVATREEMARIAAETGSDVIEATCHALNAGEDD